jgi:formylglycine-generating enzyme required for sulfatase activity
MLSSHRIDDEFILRIVPGSALVRAVEQAKAARQGKREAGSLYLQDSNDRATRAVMKDWRQDAGSSAPPSSPTEIASLTQKLLEVAHPRANQLPENFPHRYLELRLGLLLRLTDGPWPPSVDRIGDFVANLAEFVADLSLLPWEMREQIAACMEIGRGLGALLPASASSALKGHEAEWPPGLAKDIREKVQALQDSVAPLREDGASKEQSSAIDYNAASIEAETFRPRPNWGQMSNQAAKIVGAVEDLQRQGPLPDVADAAWTLQRELRRGSSTIIGGLPALSRFKELPFAPEMVVIPPGTFLMGSPLDEPGHSDGEGPQYDVVIPNRFAVGRYPVTFDEWDAAFAAGGVKHNPEDEGWGRGSRPAINVSWDDAQAYVNWLSEKTGSRYRLPSEAEWEYVCRADTTTAYWFGDQIREDQANLRGIATEVGLYPPNGFGVYDMHANVAEWCEDRGHASYMEKPDDLKETGSAWVTGKNDDRVFRGGSFFIGPEYLRSACRSGGNAKNRDYYIGFRVVRTITH